MSSHAPERSEPPEQPNAVDIEAVEAVEAQLPDDLDRLFRERLRPGETIRYSVETDLRPEGRFGNGFVIATDQRLYALSPDDSGPESWLEVPLETIERLETREYQGAAALLAVTPERALPLARFTKGRLDDIHKFQRAVKPLLIAGVDSEEHPEWGGGHKKDICEKCGQAIPHWFAGVCPNCLDKKQLIGRLLLRVQGYWAWISVGLILMLAMMAMDLVQPILTKYLIDDVLPSARHPKGDLPLLWTLLSLIVGLALAGTIINGVRGYLMAWLGEKVTLDLRNELYRHIQSLSLAFYDSKQTGWIMDRVGNDTGNLQDFLTDAVQDFIRDAVQVVLITFILFKMNTRLAAATLLPLPFITWISYIFIRRTHKMYHLMWRRRSRLSQLLSDVVPGVRVVKAFAQEDREKERYESRSQDYMNASLTVAKFSNMVWPTVGFMGSLGFVVVWGYGGYLAVIGDGVTAGTLFAFMAYYWRFQGPLQNLSRMTQRVQRAATSAQRVFEVLDTQPSVAEPTVPKQMPPIHGSVEFRDVVFGYEEHNPVLKGVSFTVAPGEMIGLVGPSGAGKSTTINLISRFYDVNDGAILVDGIDIRDVDIHSLRSQIGVVLQEPYLFHGTIAENIAYGNPDAEMEEIMSAAKAANAHEFVIKAPEGYDTMVGERGARLSGGERQRISIARAILKNPRILILDEATSSVDTETEAQIREAIDRLVKNRTTFAIAHRFSTLRNADRLVVLDQGKLVEVGTHEELMAKDDGLFHRLTTIQSEMSQIVAVGG